MNVLSPLSFDDFLKTPRTAADSDSAYTMSLIPPTPQDILMTRPMISPAYHGPFDTTPTWNSTPSTGPFATGILPTTESKTHELHTVDRRSRSPSVGSMIARRHSPYTHSRKSSGASASSAILLNDQAPGAFAVQSSGSINPAQLGGINPSFLRPRGDLFLSSSNSDNGTDYSYNAFPQLDDSDESESDDEPVPSRPEAKRTISTRSVPAQKSRSPTPLKLEKTTKSDEDDQGSLRARRAASKGKRRTSTPVEDSTKVKLVTAITASGKKSHARKRPEDHIPRPRNAFILFRKHVVDAKLIPPEVEIRHQNISVVVSKMWAEAAPDVKAKFQNEARIEKEAHMKNYPDYKYQPVYRRSNVVRRKMKPDPVEEKRCTVVASLLLEGKEGAELEAGAAKAVEASNKKRAKIQRALAAKEARTARQARKPAGSRRTRQASTSSPRDASASESGSSEPESEQEEEEEQNESQGEQMPLPQSAPTCNDMPGLWADGFEGNGYATGEYDTTATAHTSVLQNQYAPVEVSHQPSTSQQYFDFQPDFYQDLQTDFHQPVFDPSNGFASGGFQPLHNSIPVAQPADYIMAMYENDMQPLGFTAGPPAGQYNTTYGVYDNVAMPNLDFDMSHYEEALADVTGFQGTMGGIWQ